MDFATAPFVTEAIRRRLENPVLGYTAKPDSYYQAIMNWNKNRYGLEVEKEMIRKALERHHGRRKNAAKDLKISERTLYRKIKEYGLE